MVVVAAAQQPADPVQRVAACGRGARGSRAGPGGGPGRRRRSRAGRRGTRPAPGSRAAGWCAARWRSRGTGPARPRRCRPASAGRGRKPSRTSTVPLRPSHDVEQPRPAVQGDDAGGEHGARAWVSRPGTRSRPPRACAPRPAGPGSSTSGCPYSRTAAITVAQPTPRSAATAATVCPSWPTRRHASAAGPLGQRRPRPDLRRWSRSRSASDTAARGSATPA